MHGCIRFSNGKVLWFNENNLDEVIATLTDKQRQQIIDILKKRLGPEASNEFGIDEDVHKVWRESVHRKDVKLGGGSKNGESNINKKGTKKLTRNWHEKGDSEKNLTWLFSIGFRRKWSKDLGYTYRKYGGLEIPTDWIQELDHEHFKVKVKELLDND